MQRKLIVGFISDLIMVSLAYIFCVWLKPGNTSSYFISYFYSFILFLFIWTSISYVLNKYKVFGKIKWHEVVKVILISNAAIFLMVTGIMYLFQSFNYSRFIVLGTIGLATISELTFGSLFYMVAKTKIKFEKDNFQSIFNGQFTETKEALLTETRKHLLVWPKLKFREEYLKLEIGEEAFRYVINFTLIDSPDTLVIGTTTRFNIDTQLPQSLECILNVKRVNDIRYINKFFESVNSKLKKGGIFIDFVETKNLRKKRLLHKFPPLINYIYYSIDFIIKRVLPKFALTKSIYFILTRGENRVLTKAETFGRLYSCGFEILDERFINNYLYFVAIKSKDPVFPKNPSYGPIVALERIGKGGKIIKVYKMRTMHPFAEYLQDYIYRKAGLEEGGKFKNDFRITTIGKIMRSFWLDELPMLLNLVRGDLKLVGVRPLSRQYFLLYTPELQRLRLKHKPGLIPPFYADYPKTLEDIMLSEINYLKLYERHPFRTDWVYFWKAIYNIIFKKYRSR